MPLSIVPSTVRHHVPEIHAENVPAASPTNVSAGVAPVTIVPTNVPHVDLPHVAIPTDFHVDIPHATIHHVVIPTDLPHLDPNFETTTSTQNHATQNISIPISIHPMM
ncbi:hypothetical protein U1Q18_040043 [Sarracenia purpurea var. burkii]